VRTKYVGPVHLPADIYQQLEKRAAATDRDPLQMARWLIKQALGDQPDRDNPRDLALAAAGPEPDRAA